MKAVVEFSVFLLLTVAANMVILQLVLPFLVERYLARRTAELREYEEAVVREEKQENVERTGAQVVSVHPGYEPPTTRIDTPSAQSSFQGRKPIEPPHAEPANEVVLFGRSSSLDLVAPVERPPTASLRSTLGPLVDVLLTKDVMEVGRSPECDVLVDAATVSRRHFTLHYRADRWYLSSHDTGNGTFVNGVPAAPGDQVALESGDRIGIGREILLVLRTPQVVVEDLVLSAGAASHRGGREHNEDNHSTSSGFIAVADGVGGRPDGEVASRLAVEMAADARDQLTPAQMVVAIDGAIKDRSGGDSMATTFDGAQLCKVDGRFLMRGAHIGDGYVFLDDGKTIRALTVPHTLTVRAAERTRLLRALGLPQPARADDWEELAVAGHRYLLTTDGLVDSLGMDGFRKATARLRGETPENTAEQLVDHGLRNSAVSRGSIDNLTVVVADITRESSTAWQRLKHLPTLGR